MTSACVGQTALQQLRKERLLISPATISGSIDANELRTLNSGIEVVEVTSVRSISSHVLLRGRRFILLRP